MIKKYRKYLAYLEIFLLLFITIFFLFFIFNWTMSVLIHQRKEIMVPSIEGKPLTEALEIVSNFELGLKKEGEEYHPQVPAETITRQNPAPGMIVREGKIIKVIISQGSDLVFVPDVVGMSLRKAELIIRKSQLKVGTKQEIYSLKYDKEKVMKQYPRPEKAVAKNTPISLVICLGNAPEGIILMPDFAGKDIQEVNDWLEQNKGEFNCEIIAQYQPTDPEKVIRQEPSPDTIITETTMVEIIISTGGETQVVESYQAGEFFYYEVPQTGKNEKVRITLTDNDGERKIYSEVKPGGSKIRIAISRNGEAKIRVFLNDIIVKEEVVENLQKTVDK